jgi:endonuclease/exonuclease/phosphatase family metal-dependent hydrolase
VPQELRIVTWNLQGSKGVDVAEVVDRIRLVSGGSADVVLLQEVRRRQANRIARGLGMAHVWVRKHWPIIKPAEGLATLVAGTIRNRRVTVLEAAPFWSWRRRVMVSLEAEVKGCTVAVANVHLSAHDESELRSDEAARVLLEVTPVGGAAPCEVVLGGDFNDHPGSPAHRFLTDAGWRDCWAVVHGEVQEPAGASNWTPGDRTGRPPTQRLDFAFVHAGWEVLHAAVPEPTSEVPGPTSEVSGPTSEASVEGQGASSLHRHLDDWAQLSDHLPVSVHLSRPLSKSP